MNKETIQAFESLVQLEDQEKNLSFSHRIYMNHILSYRGYRFYQSSYDTDEKGTVLSVNRDSLGTTATYTGYFLLFLGILLDPGVSPVLGGRLGDEGEQDGNDADRHKYLQAILSSLIASGSKRCRLRLPVSGTDNRPAVQLDPSGCLPARRRLLQTVFLVELLDHIGRDVADIPAVIE